MTEQSKKRILIIDDEVALTRMLQKNLERDGNYEVRTENYGLVGLDAVREFMPDLVLLDIVLPDAEGSFIAAQISGDESINHIPVVFLTALLNREELEAKGGAMAGYPLLAKPVSLEELKECIQKNIK